MLWVLLRVATPPSFLPSLLLRSRIGTRALWCHLTRTIMLLLHLLEISESSVVHIWKAKVVLCMFFEMLDGCAFRDRRFAARTLAERCSEFGTHVWNSSGKKVQFTSKFWLLVENISYIVGLGLWERRFGGDENWEGTQCPWLHSHTSAMSSHEDCYIPPSTFLQSVMLSCLAPASPRALLCKLGASSPSLRATSR